MNINKYMKKKRFQNPKNSNKTISLLNLESDNKNKPILV